MIRKLYLLAVLLLCAGMMTRLPAQTRADFAWWNSPLRVDLKLTDEQSDKIRSVVRGYRNRLLDARNNVRKAEGELEDLLNEDHYDGAAGKTAVERLAGARAESTRVFTEMSLELRKVLTLEQWRVLVRKWAETHKGADVLVTP